MEKTMTPTPSISLAMVFGWTNLSTTSTTRYSDEPATKAAWAKAARGSALPWPNRCSRSAGTRAARTANRVTREAAASMIESISAESTLTDPVMNHATPLKAIRISAALTEAAVAILSSRWVRGEI